MIDYMDIIPRTLLITVMGMGIVFLVLVFLQFTLMGQRIMFGPKKKEDNREEKPVVVSQPEVIAQEVANPMDDNELIAVISAAIAACMGTESNIVVRNIRRVEGHAPSWSKAGRTDVMANRF